MNNVYYTMILYESKEYNLQMQTDAGISFVDMLLMCLVFC